MVTFHVVGVSVEGKQSVEDHGKYLWVFVDWNHGVVDVNVDVRI